MCVSGTGLLPAECMNIDVAMTHYCSGPFWDKMIASNFEPT